MEEIGSKLIAAGADEYVKDMGRADKATADFASGVDDAAKGANKGGGAFSKLGSVLKGALAAGAGVALGAMLALGGAILGAEERVGQFQAVLGNDISSAEIAAINEEVALLERRFGADLPGSLDASRQLMTNFGLSSEQAMDVLTAGFENGLNVGDDFLDTLREYSPMFANLGFDADDTLSIINRGLEAGARNSDLVADAVKEFGILIREPATLEAVSKLDKGVAKLVDQFQDGKITGEEAFDSIIARLGAIKDPILRNQIGIEVFGTKWEDLGEKAVLALGKTDEGLINSAGAAERAGEKLTGLGEIFPRLGDIVTTALIPLSDGLLAFVNEYWPTFEDGVRDAIRTTQDFFEALGGNSSAFRELPESLQNVIGLVDNVQDAFAEFAATPWGQEIQQGAQVVADYFSGPFQEDLSRGIGVVQGKFNEIAASPWGQDVQAGAQIVAEYFANDFAADFQRGADLAGGFLSDLAAAADENTKGIQAGLAIAGSYMLNEFPGDFRKGVDLVGRTIAELPTKAQAAFDDLKSALTDGVAGFVTGAQRVGAAIVEGIADGISDGASIIVDAAKRAAQAALDAAKALLGIESPSRVFADEVGAPITAGMAQGILDNLPVLLDATATLGSRVLEEAEGFAETIRDALGPILAEGFRGAADYARGQISAIGGVEALAPDRRELDRLTQDANRVRADLQEKLADIADRRVSIADEIAQLERGEGGRSGDRLTEIGQQRARLEFTAANNIDPQVRERAAQDLAKLADEEAKIRAERETQIAELRAELAGLSDEERAAWEARNTQSRLIGQQQDEAIQRFMAQEAIQRQAQADIAALRQEASAIVDPAERARFFAFRQAQILELAELDRDAAMAANDAERATFAEQRRLLLEAQQFETQLARDEAEARRAQQQQDLADAASAMGQLGALIYFSQQDMQGVGQEAIRGVAAGMLSQMQQLSTQLGGAFDAVIAGLRQRLGIASPSQVFADLVGGPMAQGVALGFLNQIPAVEAQIQATIQRLPASASQIITTTYQRQQSSTVNIGPMDLRGAAPGVGREVQQAITTAMNAAGVRADALRRTA
jgi:Phage-related minor tail protein